MNRAIPNLLSQCRRQYHNGRLDHLSRRSHLLVGSNGFVNAPSFVTSSRLGSFSVLSKRPLSSATASQPPASRAEAASTSSSAKPKRKDDSNIFLDNLGKIFLTLIAGVIATLVRSSRNSKNRITLRDELEDDAVIDPIEIDDLRIANSEMSPEVFRTILHDVHQQFTDGTCTYKEFVKVVRATMVRLKGEAFTIQLGHLLDRVVVDVLKVRNKSSEDKMPVGLWLSVLSIALNSSVRDRVRILYETLEQEESPVTFAKVLEMVGYLQDTWQLPADTQLIATEDTIPTQQWKVGTPKELVPWDGLECDEIDVEAFAAILRSRAVCAWGECYHKKKFKTVDDM